MTVGAAGGINSFFKAFINPDDEIIAFAPYFGEYRAYAANVDAKLVVVAPDTETFQPDLKGFEAAITPKTKILVLAFPNNHTGNLHMTGLKFLILQNIMTIRLSDIHTVNHFHFLAKESDTSLYLMNLMIVKRCLPPVVLRQGFWDLLMLRHLCSV